MGSELGDYMGLMGCQLQMPDFPVITASNIYTMEQIDPSACLSKKGPPRICRRVWDIRPVTTVLPSAS